MKSRLSKRGSLLDPLKTFCQRTTIHGLSYFFDDISVFERALWVFITVAFIIYGAMSVHSSLKYWNDNPIITVTDNVEKPITELHYPVITICPDFPVDRWGFLRNLLNLLKLHCDDWEVNCDETELTRHFFRSNEFVSRPSYPFPHWMTLDLSEVLSGPPTLNEVNFLVGGDYFSEEERKNPIYKSYRNHMNVFVHQNEHLNIEELLKRKLSGRGNNFSIFKALGINLNRSLQSYPSGDDLNLDFLTLPPSTIPKIIKAHRFLSLPLLGKAGTLLSKVLMLSPEKTWYKMTEETLYMLEFHDGLNLNHYLINITDKLTAHNLGINILDIASILSPVAKFKSFSKYSKQFPSTLARHKSMMGMNETNIFAITNYFGKLLGPHLEFIMEVMFHNMLRTSSFSNERFYQHSKVFRNIHEALQFPIELEKEPFRPNWEDYNMVESFPYWWPTSKVSKFHFFSFENEPDSFRTDQTFQKGEKDFTDRILKQLKDKYHYQQMMVSCKGPRQDENCRKGFTPSLTDQGICHSFNVPPFDSSFNDNAYLNIFKRIFRPKNAFDVFRNENSGKEFTMTFVLDSFSSYQPFEKPSGKFLISINAQQDFMSTKRNAIEVEVGQHTKIAIQPYEYHGHQDLRNMELEKRKCRFNNEVAAEGSMFTFYSYEACRFECRLAHARKMCGCTPWNYPHVSHERITEICDGVQAYCFEKQMFSPALNCNDNCLPSCDRVEFTKVITKQKLSSQEECGLQEYRDHDFHDENKLGVLVAEKMRHLDGEEFFFWEKAFTEKYVHNLEDGLVKLYHDNSLFRYMNLHVIGERCQEIVENDFAVVTIELSFPYFQSYLRKPSIDFFSKLGLIGGTVGLFAGVSLLSFVEIFFWTIQIFIKRIIM